MKGKEESSKMYWPTHGWKTSSPEEQGIAADRIERLADYIHKDLPLTTSMLLVRHGYVVFEFYKSNDKYARRDVWSITKSFLSALIGIALSKGYIQSIDQRVIDYFPECKSGVLNPDVNRISIRHLLTMSSGMSSDVIDSTVSTDIFSKPLWHQPGERFFYNNLDAQLLSIILTKTTGLTAFEFAKKNLFSVMGINDVSWSSQKMLEATYSDGGFGIQISTTDSAKLGLLYLNQGVWERMQIVAAEWVTNSTQRQIEVPKTDWYFIENYGYLWWIRSIHSHNSYTALGAGGQYIYVVPDLDVVAVVTSSDTIENEASYLNIIDRYIIPLS
jgi:CubicO group peptidase (beta-lactamase class C family)